MQPQIIEVIYGNKKTFIDLKWSLNKIMKPSITPTQVEHKMGPDDFIVSKTDLKGRITYANRIFLKLGQYPLESLLNTQHNIVRHPDMPRGVYKMLWETLKQGSEFFGFVKNMCANGDYYWVFANVTPDYNVSGQPQGYYSVRRKPSDSALATIKPIYKEMLSIEKRSGAKDGAEKSLAYLNRLLAEKNTNYKDYTLSLFEN